MTAENIDNALLYIIPSSLLLFLVLVFYKKFNRHRHNRKKSKKLLKKLNTFDSDGAIINYLRKINPYVFEELILDSFESMNWKVIRNKRYSGDGGIDGIVISPKQEKFLIQAKRYKSYVNFQHFKEFEFKCFDDKTVSGGFFIHTGKTGKSIKTLKNPHVQTISGNKLINLIKGEYGSLI